MNWNKLLFTVTGLFLKWNHYIILSFCPACPQKPATQYTVGKPMFYEYNFGLKNGMHTRKKKHLCCTVYDNNHHPVPVWHYDFDTNSQMSSLT